MTGHPNAVWIDRRLWSAVVANQYRERTSNVISKCEIGLDFGHSP